MMAYFAKTHTIIKNVWLFLVRNICVAILDSGIYREHREFFNVPVYFKDFVNDIKKPYDDNGHGTHISGIIAGKRVGLNRDVSILSIKVLDKSGAGNADNVRRACDYIISRKDELGICVVNMSIGVSYDIKTCNYLEESVFNLYKNNIVTVCSAGNEGPAANSITCPGNSRWAVTVGSYDDYYYMDSKGIIHYDYSGRGPDGKYMVKPDFLAMGSNVISAGLTGRYGHMSGTSMAAPKISALVAGIYMKNPDYMPYDVKLRLINMAKDVKLSPNRQGYGLIDDYTIKNYINGRQDTL